MKTLLAIFANPFDESFGPAGTFVKYAHDSVTVCRRTNPVTPAFDKGVD